MLLTMVKAGDHLIATATLEPIHHGRHTVSVVMRKNRQNVVVSGELVFEQAESSRAPLQSAASGEAPIETTFHARTQGDDWLLNGSKRLRCPVRFQRRL